MSRTEEALNYRTRELHKHVCGYVLDHVYVKASTCAKALLDELFYIKTSDPQYDHIVYSWTQKVGKILKDFYRSGALRIYSRNKNYITYKSVDTNSKEDEDTTKNRMEEKDHVRMG